MPTRWATAAASERLVTPSFARMFDTWTLAVFVLMNSVSAIWRLVFACATRSPALRAGRVLLVRVEMCTAETHGARRRDSRHLADVRRLGGTVVTADDRERGVGAHGRARCHLARHMAAEVATERDRLARRAPLGDQLLGFGGGHGVHGGLPVALPYVLHQRAPEPAV